ncbi:MAG: galactokinase [Tissierellaceae bacterium]|nr:galactokinase [Tissierellaceae bacterium]
MDLVELKSRFQSLYGQGETLTFFSPSRINIIGEHIDYNGGKVLPGAIEIGTYGIARKRNDDRVLLTSENIDLKVEVDLSNLQYDSKHGWGNYPKGVLYFMKEIGYNVGGVEVLIHGNIPNGAGLSSSASLELLIAQIINVLYNKGQIPMIDLVKVGQKAENDFVGVKCGIMDQFAIGMGKQNKASLLDTNSLDYEYIDMELKDNIIVIMNTNKRRELSDSKYNERRSECETALEIIREYIDIKNLCDLSVSDFKKFKDKIKQDNIRNRAEHVVFENHRVNLASKALIEGDIDKLGTLLIDSHNSLRDLYDVTGVELDTIVDAANSFGYCIGARMTGAGFGGCAIAIVKSDKVDEFIEYVGNVYKDKIGYEAEFYITGIGDGTREL